MNQYGVWCFCWVISLATLASAELQRYRVIGPEFPGEYKHPASLEQLRNGDLYIVYYGGEGEYKGDTAVYGLRRKAGETAWSQPVIIADTPYRAEGNGVVWQAPDGLVWLFYVCRYGETWSESRIKAKISRDQGHTWSDSDVIAFELGMMVRGRPIVLDNGEYLLPVYLEKGNDRESVGAESVSRFLRYDAQGHVWLPAGEIRSSKGNIQPAIAQLSDHRVVAYCRRGGGYGPTTDGFVVRSESHDNGRTWTPGQDSEFPNPNAAVDFLRLKNGHLLLVYNRSMTDRSPLSVAISTDEDRTYPIRRDLFTASEDYAYPSAIQAHDGKIHVVFTSDGRKVINHAVFQEEDIR